MENNTFLIHIGATILLSLLSILSSINGQLLPSSSPPLQPRIPWGRPFLPTPSPSHHHHHDGGSTRLDTSSELVLGTFSQEQENAWFYETYYPIVLKLPIPDWSPDAHRLNRSAPRCDNDNISPNYLCPSQHHMDSLLIRLSHSTRFFKNIQTASLFSTEKDSKFYDDNLNCMRIKPHFYHFSTPLKGMDPYLAELRKKCPLAKGLQMIEKVISAADVSQAKVRQAYDLFTKLHAKNRPKLDNLASNALNSTNATVSSTTRAKHAKMDWELAQDAGYTTFQNAFTLFTYADSVRWSNAYTTCQSYRLDVNLIPPQVLKNILDDASRNLTRLGLGYNISVPMDKLLTNFYKLPLTDCVLAMDGASDAFMILRLLVPVTKIFKHYKLMRLSKVPFFIRQTKHDHRGVGSLCEISNYHYDEPFLVEYDTSLRGDFMPVITAVMKAPPTCGPYHVCRIPDSVHRALVDSCVEGIIAGDEEITKEECGFKCYPVSKKQVTEEFPFVIPLTSNRFAIVGAMMNETRGRKVSIKCFGRTRLDWLKQEKMDEATVVTLPCPCQISLGDIVYLPEHPCNGTLEVIHITHVVGNGYEGFKSFEGEQKSKSIQDAMNGSKGNTRNHTGGGEGGKKDEKKVLPDEEEEEEGEEQEEDIVLEDDVMFSIPFADNRKSGISRGNGTPSEELLVVVDASGGDGYVCTHIIVWILCFILLGSNIAMLVALYKQGFVSMDGILFMK